MGQPQVRLSQAAEEGSRPAGLCGGQLARQMWQPGLGMWRPACGSSPGNGWTQTTQGAARGGGGQTGRFGVALGGRVPRVAPLLARLLTCCLPALPACPRLQDPERPRLGLGAAHGQLRRRADH